jgi:methyl-accepting chemotaxis protein
MKALFAPAILLLNRLRFPVKFALLGLIALLVVGALLFQLAMSLRESIVYAEELEASERLPRVLKVIQLLQQHRGLSSGVLSGNEAMRPLLQKKTEEVVEAMKQGEAGLSGGVAQSASQRWKQVAQDWEACAPAACS